MVAMSKLLSNSDTKNKRLELPARSLPAFPIPDGQNSTEFVAFDRLQRPWKFKVSIRNQGKYLKPWLTGEWAGYVHRKGLRKGDKVIIMTTHDEENGNKIFHIRAERKLFGFWYSIDDQQ
uniref:TF-B3 domain-containing protein n=1 Tax=Salix viminalis TaxID=40686 RepID=A0A6N2KYT3_SALVM